MCIMYTRHDTIPAHLAETILVFSGAERLTDVPLADINGFIEMMEGQDE